MSTDTDAPLPGPSSDLGRAAVARALEYARQRPGQWVWPSWVFPRTDAAHALRRRALRAAMRSPAWPAALRRCPTDESFRYDPAYDPEARDDRPC